MMLNTIVGTSIFLLFFIEVLEFGVPDEDFSEAIKAAVDVTPGYSVDDDLAKRMIEPGRTHITTTKRPVR